ncbi:hypothetical protein ACUIJN_22835 [Metabacillus halosaccharovorans]|uniref:hypothetical protein n=1 Tax=Metabacillus halosaccharovorans TaxID=930124 RepID=UPI00403DFC61
MGTLQNELSKWSTKNKVKTIEPKSINPKKKKEKLSQRDLEDLMGIRRPRYERGSGGAYRQR